MTVPISDRLSQLYVGNGANTRFDFTFRVFEQEDLTGVVVRLKGPMGFDNMDPTLYTVTLNADGLGGHVEFIDAPLPNVYFFIAGSTPLDQLLDITNYDNFYPDAIEKALDKLTALLQEWGTQLDQEKQSRILADIHYDSLAMEREENLENRLISYINAVVGITNPKIFDGITDRMVITKDGRTQREFNESIPFWTDDYVAFKQETYIREEKIIDHADTEIANTKSTLEASLSAETTRAMLSEQILDNRIDAIQVGNFAYKTYAEMDADKANIPFNSKVTLTNDPDPSKNHDWQWDGTVFTPSAYDPIAQSKTYTDGQVSMLSNAISLKKTDDPSILPILSDAAGKALAYHDMETDRFVGAGLLEQIFGYLQQIKTYEDDRYIVVLSDDTGKILLGWDKLNDTPIGFDIPGSQAAKKYYVFEQPQQVGSVNHMLWYGESYTMGASAETVLSTSQPYSNLTFDSGPRKDVEATSIIKLREFFKDPSIEGPTYHDRGETCCSGAANYASVRIMKQRGIAPNNHVIFASTAGHGSFKLTDLIKGAPWYPKIVEHINKAKELINDPEYTPQIINFVQGANDAAVSSRTPKATYKPMLAQLQVDAETDIKAASGKNNPIRFMLAQMSYGTRAWPDIAATHLELCKESDKFMFVTPMYHFPYAGDHVHLTNVGYKWMSAYFGRAYDQYIYENRKPDFINPLNAYVENDTVIVKFDVPTLPLQIDTVTLAKTQNSGFKVMSGAIELVIEEVTASNDTAVIKLSAAPTGDVQVRYGLDYQGDGLHLTEGASGNLRDSTKEFIQILGSIKPLYHLCPHFEMTAYLDKGI